LITNSVARGQQTIATKAVTPVFQVQFEKSTPPPHRKQTHHRLQTHPLAVVNVIALSDQPTINTKQNLETLKHRS
jgi:hypothetical protein